MIQGWVCSSWLENVHLCFSSSGLLRFACVFICYELLVADQKLDWVILNLIVNLACIDSIYFCLALDFILAPYLFQMDKCLLNIFL